MNELTKRQQSILDSVKVSCPQVKLCTQRDAVSGEWHFQGVDWQTYGREFCDE